MRLERQPLEEGPPLESDGHVALLGGREQRAQRLIFGAVVGDADDAQPFARGQRFADRVNAVDEIVEIEGYGAAVLATVHVVPSFASLTSMPQRKSASRSRSDAAQSLARRACVRSSMTRSTASPGVAPSSKTGGPPTSASCSARSSRSTKSGANATAGSSSQLSSGATPRMPSQ